MAHEFSRVFVLGIDGVPHSLLRRFCAAGVMPNLTALETRGSSRQIDSVYPTVSNVAWASFQTGKGPGKFGIFGFAEVDDRLGLRLPNSSHLRSRIIQELASAAGKRVISLSLPGSYPPRQVNGLMVGGFLAPSLDKAVRPASRAGELAEMGYQLDVDPVRARGDLEYLKTAAVEILRGRRRTTRSLLGGDWDLFLLHVMETDRVNHFMWRLWESAEPASREFFEGFYRQVDDLIGLLDRELGGDVLLLILSDHGFCMIRHEVELNRWLMSEGYLKLSGDPAAEMFGAVSSDSLAFSMVPGRIHLLRAERYGRGGVGDGNYRQVRDELIARLRQLRGPDGQSVCKSVFEGGQVFFGPYAADGPDILVAPHDGYDLKASLAAGDVFSSSPITGMHTHHDAYLYARGAQLGDERRCLTDVTRSVLDVLAVPVPDDMDSRGVLG